MNLRLPHGQFDGSENFYGSDWAETFTHNTAVLKDIDWKWHHQSIQYKINSLGYRCNIEFDDDFDFSNYIVVLGCSQVMGIGNLEAETITNFLEIKTGKKVINMGVGGGSNSLIYDNLMWLLSRAHRPLRIVVCWSSLYRDLYYDVELHSHNMNTWNVNTTSGWTKDFKQQYLTDYIERDAFAKFEMVKKMRDAGVYSFNFFNYGEYSVNGGSLSNKQLKEPFLEYHNFGNDALNAFHDKRLYALNGIVTETDIGPFLTTYYARDIQGLESSLLTSVRNINSHYPKIANNAMATFISENINL